MLETKTAEVEVLGTVFSLGIEGDKTCLNVDEGAVRLTRRMDGQTVDVLPLYQAVVSSDSAAALTPVTATRAPDRWHERFTLPPAPRSMGVWRPADERGPSRLGAVTALAFGAPRTGTWTDHRVTVYSQGASRLVTLRRGDIIRVRYRAAEPVPRLRVFLCTKSVTDQFLGNFEVDLAPEDATDSGDGWRSLTSRWTGLVL